MLARPGPELTQSCQLTKAKVLNNNRQLVLDLHAKWAEHTLCTHHTPRTSLTLFASGLPANWSRKQQRKEGGGVIFV